MLDPQRCALEWLKVMGASMIQAMVLVEMLLGELVHTQTIYRSDTEAEMLAGNEGDADERMHVSAQDFYGVEDRFGC